MIRRSPHDREIARLAIPALGALIAEPLYILIDTAVVGHLGTDELAGLAVAAGVLLTGFWIFIFLAYGTTAAISRLLGAGQEREAAHQAVQSLWLAALIGIALLILGLVFVAPLVGALGAGGVVRTNALVFLRISLFGVPFQLLVLAGTGYLRGLQDTRTPLLVAIGSAAFNLVLELVLIFGLDQGIGASALSTVIAQALAASVYLGIIGRSARRLDAAIRPDPSAIARLAGVGGHLFVRTAALRAALLLNTAVAARVGVIELGAHQIAFELWNFLALVLDALAIAGQAMIGRFLGASDTIGARAAGRRLLELGVVGGLGVGAAFAVGRTVLPDLFTDDAEVAHLAGFLMWWVAAMQPVNAIVFVLDGLLIGAGDMRYLAGAMATSFGIYFPFAAAVLVFDLGIGWLWFAIAVLMVARLVTLGTRWRTNRWAVVGAVR